MNDERRLEQKSIVAVAAAETIPCVLLIHVQMIQMMKHSGFTVVWWRI